MAKILIFASLLMAAAGPALAETAAEAAQALAKQRGYNPAETKCFSDTFPQFASLNPNGKWAGPKGKAARAYKATLASCGVNR